MQINCDANGVKFVNVEDRINMGLNSARGQRCHLLQLNLEIFFMMKKISKFS